jgi:hypothetical protein
MRQLPTYLRGSTGGWAQEMIAHILSEYQSGTPTTQLTETYGIGKGTVLRLLRERGDVIRHQHRR